MYFLVIKLRLPVTLLNNVKDILNNHSKYD